MRATTTHRLMQNTTLFVVLLALLPSAPPPRAAEAVLTIDLLYDTGARGPHRPAVRNVLIENVTIEPAKRGRSANSPQAQE